MKAGVDLTELEERESDLEVFALGMLGKVIMLEENQTGRMSGLRVFCHLKIEKGSEKHSYYVNEITRTNGAALFRQWDSDSRLNMLFTHMSNTLH